MITGVILAGGMSRRMGGVDKGLQLLQGRPMLRWVIDRFRPQVDRLLINANRHQAEYADFGCQVISDVFPGFAGPLAGLHAAMVTSGDELVACVPCDSPFLPADLVSRLLSGLNAVDAAVAVARTEQRRQPVFNLCRRDVLPKLTDFLSNGGRKVDLWLASVPVVELTFADGGAFENLNTSEDLSRCAKQDV
ncbi:MAG TPA: molybdenum cofactor guanylyltransferase MobA [Accumulibacter sp.]|nr:molybdenum cofactor guanylyltransferase MobA [Accumulibacter sp.]HPP46092.1 molybdenum cofactor guanylyltransferase MobA [Accumulibacter sp.]